MDHFSFQISVTKDMIFDHWQDLYKHIRDTLISNGIHDNFIKVDKFFRSQEICPNCVTATFHIASNTITKTYRLSDGNNAKIIFDQFLIDNSSKILELNTVGILYGDRWAEQNVKSNLEIINDEIQSMPSLVIPETKFSLLKNLKPIYTKETEHGIMYVKQDYIEYWFNSGTIDYLYNINFGWQLYFYLYYQMYRRNFINNYLIRYAFFKIYDYENYISLRPPTEDNGKPDLFDPNTVITNEYIMLYINQAAEIIDEWKQIGNLFPNDPIRLENRIKDSRGYYFIFLGSELDHTLPQFIKLQFEYLSQILEYLDCKTVNKTDVFNYAYHKWTVHRVLVYNDTRVPLFPD